jgi:ferredoxin-NADP reductase
VVSQKSGSPALSWPALSWPALSWPSLAWTRPGLGYWDHDDAALSIINLDSVAQLSTLADANIDPRRFRGNLLIKGGGAWSEFDLLGRQLQIGDAVLEILRPIDRCSATSVHPEFGEIDLNLPALLARHTGHIFCGVYARVIKQGVIRPGNQLIDTGRSFGIVKIASERPTAPPTKQWPRSAIVTAVQQESENVASFWIKDRLADEAITPPYISGQHIRLHGIGETQSSWRSYTVSGYRPDGQMRISVKRDPNGACSGWLHDTLKVGHHVTISGPFGSFVQPPASNRPITMLSAGIGITPLLAMLSGLAADAPETLVRFVHVCRNTRELVFLEELTILKSRMPNLVMQRYVDMAAPDEAMPSDAIADKLRWDDEVDLISRSHSITYMCGPKSFMQIARDQIRKAGVLDQDIHEEVFASPITSSGSPKTAPRPGPFSVTFSKSKTTADWTIGTGSLLDLAEQVGVMLPANCRGGACGSCAQTIKSGEVAYLLDPALALEGQKHLLCFAVPLSDVVIDA